MNTLSEAPHPVVGYKTFVSVWAVLVAMTLALLMVNRLHLGSVGLIATLTLTPIKAGLVLYYFMHLKYENVALKTMVFVALMSLIVFLVLLFLDYSFR